MKKREAAEETEEIPFAEDSVGAFVHSSEVSDESSTNNRYREEERKEKRSFIASMTKVMH